MNFSALKGTFFGNTENSMIQKYYKNSKMSDTKVHKMVHFVNLFVS